MEREKREREGERRETEEEKKSKKVSLHEGGCNLTQQKLYD